MYVVRAFVSHTSFNDAFTRSALSCLSVSPSTVSMLFMTTSFEISSAVVTRREKASIITFVAFVSKQSLVPTTMMILLAFFYCFWRNLLMPSICPPRMDLSMSWGEVPTASTSRSRESSISQWLVGGLCLSTDGAVLSRVLLLTLLASALARRSLRPAYSWRNSSHWAVFTRSMLFFVRRLMSLSSRLQHWRHCSSAWSLVTWCWRWKVGVCTDYMHRLLLPGPLRYCPLYIRDETSPCTDSSAPGLPVWFLSQRTCTMVCSMALVVSLV